MKKIIAFLSVLVMTIAMSATISFAADNEVVFDYEVDGTTVTIDVLMNTTYTDITAAQIYFNMEEAYAQGATVTTTAGKAGMSSVPAQKMVALAFKPTDGSMYVSGEVLGTITITGVSENFEIDLMAASTRTTTKITSVANGDVTSDFGTIAADIVVKSAPAEPVIERGEETFVATATDADGFTGVKFNFTTDYEKAANPTASAEVAFGTALENGSAVVALTVKDIIKTVDGAAVAFDCTGVELY